MLPVVSAGAERGIRRPMSFVWGVFKAVVLFFAALIAVLVVLDGTLLANLMRKREE